jgi:DNA-binding transcriptional ArsR family regulator
VTTLYPPPQIKSVPAGEPAPFDALCKKAGMRMVVSAKRLPDVRIHGGAFDFKAVAPGKVAYCIGLPLLGGTINSMAREIILKLAYQFHDWAAREVVAADKRALMRAIPETAERARKALAPTPMKLLLRLHDLGTARIGDLATELNLAQPHVSRAIRTLEDAGLVISEKTGRDVAVRLSRMPNNSMAIITRSMTF